MFQYIFKMCDCNNVKLNVLKYMSDQVLIFCCALKNVDVIIILIHCQI